MNGVFIADGAGKLEFEDLTLQLYMGGTLTEVFGLVLVVTKYLLNASNSLGPTVFRRP
ncbi:hypothetical protein MUTS15_41360 [Escherichia coli]|nr:hypothetical protein MUTS15_41360 [Escherichia coli]BDZ04045.1 hypothetical protein MUTS16_51180 [Escherichia coli]